MTGEAPVTKIGDTVYQFDANHRVYESGASMSGPIYSKHFRPYVIVGIEKRSWLIALPGANWTKKVSKGKVVTAQQMEDQCWHEDHRMRVVRLVQRADVATLQAIARLVCYDPAAQVVGGV